jgi:pimeloyl-ACP methyl ester carboxylesterase
MNKTEPNACGSATLPPGLRSRFVHGINGLALHVLEAGFENGERPCVLMLHGFPELAYSWRKVMFAPATGRLSDGAGHWVQQEQPEQVGELLLRFLRKV